MIGAVTQGLYSIKNALTRFRRDAHLSIQNFGDRLVTHPCMDSNSF